MKKIPNIITIARMLLSIILLAIVPYSKIFYIVYLLCGLGDIFDGYIARKLNCTSKFGATVDSIADGLFVMILFIKLVPVIHIDYSIVVFIIIIAIVKLSAIVIGFIRYNRLIMLHTYGNKLTGLIIFFALLCYKFIAYDEIYYIVCSIAALSAIEELIINIISKEVDLNIKGLLVGK